MISLLKPAPEAARLPADRIDSEYRRLGLQVSLSFQKVPSEEVAEAYSFRRFSALP